VTQSVQRGVTQSVQRGVTQSVQRGVTQSVQRGVTNRSLCRAIVVDILYRPTADIILVTLIGSFAVKR